jgi:photosystem II stability/assembly factor-like uncharacterized protein
MFDLWGLELINDTVGWACGATALLKTTDGGENWQRVNTPGYTGNLWWIDFLNEQYGFAAADGKVLRTTDGGNNWEVLQAGDNRPLYSIDVIDSQHIAAAGHGGTNYRGKNIYSSDGGYTWAEGAALTFEAVNDIKYTDRDTGYLVMDEVGFYKTTNRGQSWAHVTNAIGEYELSIVSHNIGYSAGTSLKIYKAEGNLESWRKLILNEDFSDVFFINEYKGFVITSAGQGKLFKTENGGVYWQLVAGAHGGGDILFIDSVTGFIGSSNGNIYKTTNGGQSWYPTNGVPNNIGKIQFVNIQTGWAAGGPVILKTTDGGENWVTQISRPATSFTSIYFIDSLIGWATALNSPPFKTTDGGQNWVRQTNLDFWQSNDIYLNDFLNGFIIISPSKLYRTVDGGNNWYIQESFQNFIRNFGWITKSHGFIMGDGVFETSDSGNTWSEVMQLRNVGLRKLHSPSNHIGYSIGNIGIIYKYSDTALIPVELISLEGKVENNKIILTWQTASELNNMEFQVEKSFNKETWFTIAFVKGKKTTTEINNYSFIENEFPSDIQYYRLKLIDYNGSYEYSEVIEVNYHLEISSFQLFQNYPNPFNSTTIINYQVAEQCLINISIYDIKGEKILELVNEEKDKGLYKTVLTNNKLPSGIFLIRMITSTNYSSIKKLTIIK